jgi:DNA-binding response OmpR family regulator
MGKRIRTLFLIMFIKITRGVKKNKYLLNPMNIPKNNPKTILIVEDDESMIIALADKLNSSGFQVITARDGKEGLSLALSSHPDIILLDIVMPKLDGLSMLKELKKDKWGMLAPVIILTNLGDSQKLAEALEIGVVEYMIKAEVKLSDIVLKVKRIMGII